MATGIESLFSLELVTEKLYLPYVTCRFPAVAFRLLDFPTILISHVEQELAQSIHRKIQRDPYYQTPDQFTELQDKHGNYMVKKGKSCLFKISLDTLKLHLSNTPLYVMVIDEYPEVPKLLGNSSIPLNGVMDAIFSDVKKNGHTVPSVHGDKGLFKIYSLMGEEIGYVVLGFRLLSLGPGLIAHLPAAAIATRASVSMQKERPSGGKEAQVEAPIKADHVQKVQATEKLRKHRDNTSMTEIETRDALMQTVELNDEPVHVAISAPEKKDLKTIQTQTERKVRPKQSHVLTNFVKEVESDESDDGLLLNPNIICPPPLFYNSKAEPKVEIDKEGLYDYESTFDDLTLEDLSEDDHINAEKLEKQDVKQKTKAVQPKSDAPPLQDAKTVVISNVKKNTPQQDVLPVNPGDAVFPILTALLNELSKVQNPQLLNQALTNVQSQATSRQPAQPTVSEVPRKPDTSVRPEPVRDTGKDEDRERNVSVNKKKGRKAHRTCAPPQDNVPKQKGWIRKAPEVGVKKTKLVFGLTNTQRLRLAKGNPVWLKTAEQDEKEAKAQRQSQKLKSKEQDHQDLDTGNLSDTYTEVRRLAAAELENTTASALTPTLPEPDRSKTVRKPRKKSPKSRDNSPGKEKTRQRSRSPRGKFAMKQPTRKGVSKSDSKTRQPVRSKTGVSDIEEEQEIVSPSGPMDSAADSVPSSRIEVHIPSVQPYDSEGTLESDDFDDELPLPDDDGKDTGSKFPGFNRDDDTLPESINGQANQSVNATIDDDSPLESTRVSKQFHTGDKPSQLFQSTEDYDTRQFHSTDEPELQQLISEEERSDSFEVTPTTEPSRRSPSPALTGKAGNASSRLSMKFEVLNPTASQQSPIPALRRSTVKVDSLSARPSPTGTPRSRSSGQDSSKQPTPRPRKPIRERRLEFKKESIHTESVSSYMPSESENILSLISDGSYSDDFHMSSEKDVSSRLSTPELPRIIPSTKLGYTIH